MTAKDRKKLIDYFEGIELAEGHGEFDIRIGTLMTEMEYEHGGDVSDGTAGTVCVNISFAKRGRKG